jgi:hypothetical protein
MKSNKRKEPKPAKKDPMSESMRIYRLTPEGEWLHGATSRKLVKGKKAVLRILNAVTSKLKKLE